MLLSKVNYRLFFNQNCSLCKCYPACIDGLCEGCHADLPWTLFACSICGLSRCHPSQPCIACQKQHFAFDQTIAALEYRFPLISLLPSIKQRHSLHHLRWLAKLLATRIKDLDTTLPDALLPVPMHTVDQLRRGYNQAAVLADELGKNTAIKVMHTALCKVKRTHHQHDLNADQRRANLSGAFSLRGKLPKHVAIVDDVMTTGSTLHEIASLLKQHGVERVDAWVIARTPQRDHD